jgi:hypothetical protein
MSRICVNCGKYEGTHSETNQCPSNISFNNNQIFSDISVFEPVEKTKRDLDYYRNKYFSLFDFLNEVDHDLLLEWMQSRKTIKEKR